MDDSVLTDEGVSEVVEGPLEGRVDNSGAKRNCLLLILAVSAIAGFLYAFVPEGSGSLYGQPGDSDRSVPIEYAGSLITTFALLAWCLFDAEGRGFKFSRKLSILFVFLPIIMFPWYIFSTRKGLGCLVFLGRSAAFIVLYIVVCVVGYVLGLLIAGFF